MKAQKLKKQFRAWEEIHQAPPLKTDHRAVFRKRLGKRKTSTFQVRLLQWAAVAIVCIGLANALGFFTAMVSEEEVRFQKAEIHLMQVIEQQLLFYETHPSPVVQEVIARSKTQLNQLQQDYHVLYEQWEMQPQQPQLIHALIQNLNTQISLLSEINQTLNALNQGDHEQISI